MAIFKCLLPRVRWALELVAALSMLASHDLLAGQNTNPIESDPVQRHYNAAQDAQATGDMRQATSEYQEFLSRVLQRLANHRAAAGDFAAALALFDQALVLAPKDAALLLDYVEACRGAGDLPRAKRAAEKALATEPNNAKAHFAMGRILLPLGSGEEAKLHLEEAVHLEPTFEHGFALALAYLKMKNLDRAATIFEEMKAGFGDAPAIHMEFGRAFSEAGYPEQGIQEFKKAIAKDDKFPGAHYSLGAAYLVGLADAAFPEASVEFRKELERHPNDVMSLYQLGYIAVSQHDLKEAERYLGRAAVLDPSNPDVYLSLGQAYSEAERPTEAEKSLRRSIELTKDVQRNHYQVQRAHYLLGRLLAQDGRQEEARRELKTADQLLKQSVASNQGQPESARASEAGENVSLQARASEELADPETLKRVEAYEKQVAPAIADSYNNLAAIMADGDRLSQAVAFFEQAAHWNPSLEGIDYNLGKAAFATKHFEEAVAPLTRYLQSHADDTLMRSALGSSLFNVKRYCEAAETLKPLESQIGANPRLDYIYSVSLVRSGDPTAGVTRLLGLAKAMPKLVDVHMALGEAYSLQGDHAHAAHEFQIALDLNPSDADAKHQLDSESALH